MPIASGSRTHQNASTSATQSGEGWTLTGTKNVVPAADQADAFIVPAMAGGQLALFLVERTAKGVSTQGYRTQDGGRAGDVTLQAAAAQLITTDGLTALEHGVDIGIAAACAEAVGVMDQTVAITVDYMNTRKQFGVAIATFQALRHRLAEAQVRTNGLYWLAMKAAATLDAGDAALAALHAQESARSCVYDFHQFLGAMGMTLEHPLHLWTYRLKALIGDLGGRGGQALVAANALWG